MCTGVHPARLHCVTLREAQQLFSSPVPEWKAGISWGVGKLGETSKHWFTGARVKGRDKLGSGLPHRGTKKLVHWVPE